MGHDNEPQPPYSMVLLGGPSGVGKTTVVKATCERGEQAELRIFTSRAARPSEALDPTVIRLSAGEMHRLRSQGQLTAYSEHFGAAYAYDSYQVASINEGRTRSIAAVYAPKFQELKQVFHRATSIYLLPTNLDLIRERMRRRGDEASQVEARYRAAIEELRWAKASIKSFDLVVTVDDHTTVEHILHRIEQHLLGIGQQ